MLLLSVVAAPLFPIAKPTSAVEIFKPISITMGCIAIEARPTADVVVLPGAVKSTCRFASLALINLKCVAPAPFVVSAAITSTCSVPAFLLDLILKTSADTCSAATPPEISMLLSPAAHPASASPADKTAITH